MSVPLYITIASSLLTGLIGLFVGNRLAIGRDRRKEFNAVAERIGFTLLKLKEQPSPCANWPDEADMFLLRTMLPAWHRCRFDDALNEFKRVHHQNSQQDAIGSSIYENIAPIVNALEQLMTFVKRK